MARGDEVEINGSFLREEERVPSGTLPLPSALAAQYRGEGEGEGAKILSVLGEMAIAIAHEMRNLLGSVELCAGMLALELKDDPPRRELAQTLIEGVYALNGIVTNLLTFARPCRPLFAQFTLHTVLDEAIACVGYALKEKRIKLVKAYSPSEPVIWADKELLKQVFLNLILNAVQAMTDGRSLSISTRVQHEEFGMRKTEVRIEDTGAGIPPEHLERIFEPFFTTKARGTGLGLALVRRILDQHQAGIQVESELGRGSVFTILFPDPGEVTMFGETCRPLKQVTREAPAAGRERW
ncbi:MAG: nitrogen regulation protein NR(II) [Candidatus Methylomirabilales bacterium]